MGLSKISLFIVIALALAMPVRAQIELPDWDSVEITTVDLGSHITMLQGFGSNIGAYTGPGGVFLVDNEYAPLSAKIMAALGELTESKVRFVINTHCIGIIVAVMKTLPKPGPLLLPRKIHGAY